MGLARGTLQVLLWVHFPESGQLMDISWAAWEVVPLAQVPIVVWEPLDVVYHILFVYP